MIPKLQLMAAKKQRSRQMEKYAQRAFGRRVANYRAVHEMLS